jgi:hypothetical protein
MRSDLGGSAKMALTNCRIGRQHDANRGSNDGTASAHRWIGLLKLGIEPIFCF